MNASYSFDDLTRYLTCAARVTGAKLGAHGKPALAPQGDYSLAWYSEHLLQRDLDPASPSYSPLLAAYLGGDARAVAPAAPDLAADETLRDQLDTCFPQSAYPLNESQRSAVLSALTNPLTVVIGPPGTGKTETILRILALAADRGWTVALVSSNHSAIDAVIDKVKASQVEGPAPAVDLAARLAERLVPLGSAKARRKAASPDGTSYGFSTGVAKGQVKAHADLTRGWEQRLELDAFCRLEDGTTRCITSTIHSLKKCFVDGDVAKYDLVVMDEASQSSPLLGIVAMSSARRLVVVGDDDQLPPVVREDLQGNLERVAGPELCARFADTPFDLANSEQPVSFLGSCLRTLCGEGGARKVMLNEHYRCHEAIIGFCVEHVYGKELQVRTAKDPNAPAFPIGIRWYEGDYREPDVRWEGKSDGWRRSVCNERQLAILVREELPHIRELAAAGKTFCFLSPFWAQTKAIAELLVDRVPELTREDLEFGGGADQGDEERRDAVERALEETMLTVHRSQGKEFDCVYLLPVEDGKWAWPWSQGKRLVNVAVSRAKEELHVIVSTKLMYDEDQLTLTGRVTKRDTELGGALGSEDERENLFVCKLVEYVREHKAEWSAAGEPGWCGIHGTELRSAFDWSANLLGHLPEDDEVTGHGASSVPEALVAAGLAHLRAEEAAGGIAAAANVRLGKLMLGDKSFAELAGAELSLSAAAHFDFVVYERATKCVLALVEVDGAQHRYKGFAKEGERRKSSRTLFASLKRDWDKERLVRALGGTCAWLGTPSGHQLVKAMEVADKSRVVPGGLDAEGNPVEDAQDDRTAGWVTSADQLPSDSRFVFIRIPTDGSTCFEFDALREGAAYGSEGLPPTVDEYVRAQLALQADGAPTMVGKLPFSYYRGMPYGDKTISGIVDKGAAAVAANQALKDMGVLKDCNGEKLPTQLGKFFGAHAEFVERWGHHVVKYDATATHLVELLLKGASSSKE